VEELGWPELAQTVAAAQLISRRGIEGFPHTLLGGGFSGSKRICSGGLIDIVGFKPDFVSVAAQFIGT
jgi:hypothetical protein